MTPKYELGGLCRNGHLLTTETSYYRKGNKHQAAYLVCRICKSAADKTYRQKNQKAIQERQLQWCHDNPEKAWKTRRRNHLKRQYDITPEDFDALWEEQNGLCAICDETPTLMQDIPTNPHKLPLYVDHCHETGTVRGLLCWHCNVALGHLNDSIPRLQAAIEYLSR